MAKAKSTAVIWRDNFKQEKEEKILRNNNIYVYMNINFIWYMSLVAQMVKHLPTVWETWVHSLGQEDPLEKEMATHFSTLAWNIPWIEEHSRLQSMGSQRVRHD